jgi:hypothetical protein
LIKGVTGARTHLVNLENLTDDELTQLQEEFGRLRVKAVKAHDENPPPITGENPRINR